MTNGSLLDEGPVLPVVPWVGPIPVDLAGEPRGPCRGTTDFPSLVGSKSRARESVRLVGDRWEAMPPVDLEASEESHWDGKWMVDDW